MLGEVIAETDDAPVLLDVRNGYEWDVGHFKGASRPVQESFRETVETNVDDCVSGPLSGVDKKKPIMMYCTGGIRCDVYSTVLKQQGYDNVFTLEGGVQAYFDEYGDREDQRWDDHLFVFDSRLAMTPKGYPRRKPAPRLRRWSATAVKSAARRRRTGTARTSTATGCFWCARRASVSSVDFAAASAARRRTSAPRCSSPDDTSGTSTTPRARRCHARRAEVQGVSKGASVDERAAVWRLLK
jgi:predicted sulfurtransferase